MCGRYGRRADTSSALQSGCRRTTPMCSMMSRSMLRRSTLPTDIPAHCAVEPRDRSTRTDRDAMGPDSILVEEFEDRLLHDLREGRDHHHQSSVPRANAQGARAGHPAGLAERRCRLALCGPFAHTASSAFLGAMVAVFAVLTRIARIGTGTGRK